MLQYPEKDLPFSVESIFVKNNTEPFSFDKNEILKLKTLLNCAALIPFMKQLDLLGKTGYKLETEGHRYSGQTPISVSMPKPTSSSTCNCVDNVDENDDSDAPNMSSILSFEFKNLGNPKVDPELTPKIQPATNYLFENTDSWDDSNNQAVDSAKVIHVDANIQPIVISSEGENSSDSENEQNAQSISLVNKTGLIYNSDRSENSENDDADMLKFINDDKEGLLEELTPKKHSDSCHCKLCENSPIVNQIYQNYLKSKLLQMRQKNVAMKSKAKKRRNQFASDSD